MDIQDYVAQYLKGLQAQTQAHNTAWHLGEEEEYVSQAIAHRLPEDLLCL